MAFGINPYMMNPMGMMGMGGMSSMFMMMQMMQMMQMMSMLMGSMGGGMYPGGGCCHQPMGQAMGMGGMPPMMPGGFPGMMPPVGGQCPPYGQAPPPCGPAGDIGNVDMNSVLQALPASRRRAAAQHFPYILAECRRQGVTNKAQIAYILATASHGRVRLGTRLRRTKLPGQQPARRRSSL